MAEQLWTKTAQTVVNAGQIPLPIGDTLLQLLQTVMDKNEAAFVQIFEKSMQINEIMDKTSLTPDALDTMLHTLMTKGVITGIPSKKTGEVIYRLMPPIPGLFEFTLMRGESGPREKKLAQLFSQLFKEVGDMVQGNYELAMEMMKTAPPLTRVVPIHREIQQKVDNILPTEDVADIIEKFDAIAVAHCYCRHEKDLLGHPCETTAERENCLFFGQTADFVAKYNFGRRISKDRAREIINKAAEDGLVHKSFHIRQDIEKDEFAICNCCKCCCATFRMYYEGAFPMHTYASHTAVSDTEICTGCGICEEKCPMEAIRIDDDIASVTVERCIGCGVCAFHCPTDAIHMERTGMRTTFVPPIKSISA